MNLSDFYKTGGQTFISTEEEAHNHLVCEVKAGNLVNACAWLREHYNALLLDAFALEDREQPGNYLVRYLFELCQEDGFVTLYARVGGQKPMYPAVSLEIHAADWFEREIYEMFDIIPAGHPKLGGFILREPGPEGSFPLRKNPGLASQPAGKRFTELPGMIVEGRGVFDMPLGPVYSGTAEAAHFNLSSIGEEIFWVTPRLFYKHRGFEKVAEDKTPEQVITLAERICGTTSVAESLAFCQAVEALAGLEVPPRGLYIRTLFAELERIYNHIGNIADICESTSLSVGTAQGYILKEKLLRLNALLTGHRYLMGINCLGGVRVDVNREKQELLRQTLREIGQEFKVWMKMLMSTDSFLDRLEGIGVVESAVAKNLSATGPVARASGVNRDFRRDHPYAVYDRVQFEIPVCEDGDGLARMKVRVAEVEQSKAIVEQLLTELPLGTPANHALFEVPSGSSAYGYCEGPRGSTLHWMKTREDGLLWRWRVRTPSFLNWHVFSFGTEGTAFQDFPIILASFGLSHAECDR